jgi:hypothetical protein
MMILLRFELAQNAPRQTHAVLVVTIYAKRKTSEARRLCNQSCLSSWMKALAKRIARDLKNGQWEHCAVYEDELKRVWPLDQKDREAKIAQFAKEYGFRLRHYKKGLCAIFDNRPRENRPGRMGVALLALLGGVAFLGALAQPAPTGGGPLPPMPIPADNPQTKALIEPLARHSICLIT